MNSKILLLSILSVGSSVIGQDVERNGFCYTQYVHVSVVKQVPSYSKHCTKVDDIKCKTTYKTSFTTKMETQCTPTFDTSCSTVLQTAYKQKICTDVPTQKCVPIPVKVEAEKCVNIPTQSCENVPVVASVPVPSKQCFRKPRRVCQTLVSTKPKIVIEKIPKTVCPHDQPLKSSQDPHLKSHSKPSLGVQSPKSKSPGKTKSHNHQHRIDQDDFFQGVSNYPRPSQLFPDNQKSGSLNIEKEVVPEFDEYQEFLEAKQNPQNEEFSYDKYPRGSYKKEDIPLYEDPSNFLGDTEHYRQGLSAPDGGDAHPGEDYDYKEYQVNAQSHADILNQYLNKHFNHNLNNQPQHYYDVMDRKDNKIDHSNRNNLFSGDIGEESDIIKRDLNKQEEPSSSEIVATVITL